MNSKHVSHRKNLSSAVAALAALIGMGFSQMSAAAEPSPAAASASPADKQVSRAEVMADLRLWLRAGLDQYSDVAVRDAQEYSYKQALAKYEALRHGPAYVEELARAGRELGEPATVLSGDQASRLSARAQ